MCIQNMAGASLLTLLIKAFCVALGTFMIKYVEQLPPYFDCALINSQHILNAHRATLGASMMSLGKKKMWQTGNRYKGFMLVLFLKYFE
jgi:hypothetical protein